MLGILTGGAVMCMAFLGLRESYILMDRIIKAITDDVMGLIIFSWPLALSYFHIIIWAIGFMHLSDSIAAMGIPEGWHVYILIAVGILFNGLLIRWATDEISKSKG